MEALHYAWHAFTGYCTGRWLGHVWWQRQLAKRARFEAQRDAEHQQRRADEGVEDAARRLGAELSDHWQVCIACGREWEPFRDPACVACGGKRFIARPSPR